MNTNITNETKQAQAHSKKSILKATGVAFVVALVILVVAILPAEYNLDPTGLGQVLGFKALAEDQTEVPDSSIEPNKPETKPAIPHFVELKVGPHQGFEYKLQMTPGSVMVYSWTSSKELEYEFHGEPEGAPKGEFISFEKSIAGKSAQGSFTASFEGRQGWYFKNNSGESITIKLTTNGYYEVLGIVSGTAEIITQK